MAIMAEVWGDYAAFNRPELKVERVSYECMTPSAARGILEAIFWHPGMRYTIDKIYVCNPIKMTNIRRNEVKAKLNANAARTAMRSGSADLCICAANEIQQRASLVLKDVRYIIEAHFNIVEGANETDNAGKFQEMLKRRLKKGQCYHQPYFGVREFPVNFRLWDRKEEIRTAYQGEKDLGYLLYDMDYSAEGRIQPMFFHAILKNGVLDLTDCEVCR